MASGGRVVLAAWVSCVLLSAPVFRAGAQPPPPLDWRRGDAYFTEDLRFWRCPYPETRLEVSDDAAEGLLAVRTVSEGSDSLGLVLRLPDLPLEPEAVEHVVCAARCTTPAVGYIRLGSGPNPFADYWGFSGLRFPTDRWLRLDLLPREGRLLVDGVVSPCRGVTEGRYEPGNLVYLALFNTRGQAAGDSLAVDAVGLATDRPWWDAEPAGAVLTTESPSDPRGRHAARLTCRGSSALSLSLRGMAGLSREAGKLQFLLSTTRRAEVELSLASGDGDECRLRFPAWTQAPGRYALVEYAFRESRLTVDAQTLEGTAGPGYGPARIDRLTIRWPTGCRRNDALNLEGLVILGPERPAVTPAPTADRAAAPSGRGLTAQARVSGSAPMSAPELARLTDGDDLTFAQFPEPAATVELTLAFDQPATVSSLVLRGYTPAAASATAGWEFCAPGGDDWQPLEAESTVAELPLRSRGLELPRRTPACVWNLASDLRVGRLRLTLRPTQPGVVALREVEARDGPTAGAPVTAQPDHLWPGERGRLFSDEDLARVQVAAAGSPKARAAQRRIRDSARGWLYLPEAAIPNLVPPAAAKRSRYLLGADVNIAWECPVCGPHGSGGRLTWFTEKAYGREPACPPGVFECPRCKTTFPREEFPDTARFDAPWDQQGWLDSRGPEVQFHDRTGPERNLTDGRRCYFGARHQLSKWESAFLGVAQLAEAYAAVPLDDPDRSRFAHLAFLLLGRLAAEYPFVSNRDFRSAQWVHDRPDLYVVRITDFVAEPYLFAQAARSWSLLLPALEDQAATTGLASADWNGDGIVDAEDLRWSVEENLLRQGGDSVLSVPRLTNAGIAQWRALAYLGRVLEEPAYAREAYDGLLNRAVTNWYFPDGGYYEGSLAAYGSETAARCLEVAAVLDGGPFGDTRQANPRLAALPWFVVSSVVGGVLVSRYDDAGGVNLLSASTEPPSAPASTGSSGRPRAVRARTPPPSSPGC